MRIAIPVWEEKVSPLLDTASMLLIVEMDRLGEIARFQMALEEYEPGRKARRIRDIGVDVIICGAVSDFVSRALSAAGIRVIPEISGQAEEVMDAFLRGTAFDSKLLMPGSNRRRSYSRKRGRPHGTIAAVRERSSARRKEQQNAR